MKKRSPAVQPEWDTLYPLIIFKWRKLMGLPLGPEDSLQTREFQTLIQKIKDYQNSEVLTTKPAVAAYLMYEWPLRYAEGLSLLKELPKTPQRVLELGGIGAPFSFAAMQHGATEAVSIDRRELALNHGAELCGHLGYPISIRTGDIRKLTALPIEGKWDLISLPHSLFALFDTQEARKNYIKRLLDLLTEDGHILIVESSANEINREFLMLRDDVAEEGISIAAPCLWKGNCPARGKGSSPCYAQRPLEKPSMIKNIQRALEINLSSLKMSYLLLRSRKAPKPVLADSLYRIVSPPVSTFRGERFFLCGVQGKKTLGTTLKTHPKQSKAFEYLRRGDVVDISDAASLENDLQVTENTTLRLHSPCDKPVTPSE